MKILVTGGAGFIGSHTVLALLQSHYDVVVLDNLCNASYEAIRRVEALTGKKIVFIQGDISCESTLTQLFAEHDIDAVLHFAALKAVGESVQHPYKYYSNNVAGTLCLLEAMQAANINKFIFSSSATVYGETSVVPYTESLTLGSPSSPYGASKVMIERIMMDSAVAHSNFQAISLRYFNPIGAHSSGIIGEDPKGIPNNLMPYITQVAIGRREKLSIFGNDYPTQDGTCRRDYIHVVDLAEGHVKALDWLQSQTSFSGVEAFNLGTGTPVSVLEMVNTFIAETGQDIPYEFSPRRLGDLPEFWADSRKAQKELGWQTKMTLADMVKDTWRWQKQNPYGYE